MIDTTKKVYTAPIITPITKSLPMDAAAKTGPLGEDGRFFSFKGNILSEDGSFFD
jgi:hypothetical protein